MPDPTGKTALSRYASKLLGAHPELGAELASAQAFSRSEILDALVNASGDAESEIKRRLRRLRSRVLLRVMARDLDGGADLAEVCETMSALADAEIACALGWADAQFAVKHGLPRTPSGERCDLVVVGMGKLGGRELNVSSDIDLVFLYPEEGETDGAQRVTNHEYFDRVGRRAIKLLADVTEDGFAFRVDMRLRPYGESGPLVASFEALEAYFVSQGREWERYAWIKARAITGSRHDELDAIVRPFVYRKYLDFGTLAAMRRLHAEVRRDVARRELAQHVKLGPGGIREVEFVVQALQLVRGGREPALAIRPTLEALARLTERGTLPAEAARELAESYDFLRRLEHRLQYLDDAQTHLLPTDDGDQQRIATMMGFDAWPALSARLTAIRAQVVRHFEAVLSSPDAESVTASWPDHPRAKTLRSSQRYANLSEQSRALVDRLVPALARAAQSTPDPDATTTRGVDLIEAIAGRAAYLALLAEHPEALERVTQMIGASSWAAEFVTRHPLLLDELLDNRLLQEHPDLADYESALRNALAHAPEGDVEREMNILREHHQAQVFRLLAQDLAGLLTVERLADHLSELADRTLNVAIGEAWQQVRTRHRDTPRFAVIAYGKLGGKELGYASDLDMIFLYDDDDERAQENYLRLAQRLNNLLSQRTSSGILFDTDLQLRPSGQKGLLVSQLDAFAKYQDESAWVWEHQALTRARFCAGDTRIGEAFEAIRVRILTRSRDTASLAKEVLAMREKMHAAHPNKSGLFDLKHDRGGMIDVEFIVQFLVLAHSSKHPGLTGNLGNIALLKIAAELDLISAKSAELCRTAYREFRRMQHSLRLNGAQYARVPAHQSAQHAQAVRDLWSAVFAIELT
ncbi:MAG TPA: bifunctional [glutamate--ammonia ligase]-adenylyl-L-tyrosine phosphorylase/[glutamate--ammonia-ligase] adenylyltransferase [Burkholderiales bacterium]|nr:bifunctional [glutamate--ammonia ligase]-adenylyl-L-tyrosine phosphorylase/[glutamate--ammonia-ligase] adenylyltransferase [Burkholderiales bacterium]